MMSSIRTMPPRRERHHSVEPSFPDIAQLGEAIANAIQSSLCPPQRIPLETVYNLKLIILWGMKDMKERRNGSIILRRLFVYCRVRGIFRLIGGLRRLPSFWVRSLHLGGDKSPIS
ncbi:hypothetical protein ACFX1Q_046741 [Malus domestica]